jgi:Domain of unknown function (DU1801)
MQSTAATVTEYLKEIPEDKQFAFSKLRDIIVKNIPSGFEECMQYGMISYVVPHSIYPAGYHCSPKLSLPFISIASQKNFFAIYHMGMYADENLLNWFTSEFPNHSKKKLDMGKSCIRFKKPEDIPFELIGELVSKMTVNDWITLYEKTFKK